MNRWLLSSLMTAGCLLMLATSLFTPHSMAQDVPLEQIQQSGENGSKKLRITTRPVMLISNGSIVAPAGTILVRTKDSMFATLHTTALAPGTVVSAWFGIFNNPENCATRPCTPADFSNPAVQGSRVSFGGQIIGADGAATFGAFRTVGDTTGAFDGPGLLNPLKAEIHIVTRSHGPAILDNPDALRQQLTIFNGGCPPNTCGNIQASIHEP